MPLWSIGLSLLLSQTMAIPDISSSVDLSPGKDKPDVVVDAATKQKLDDLAKTYEVVARKNLPLILRSLKMEKEPVAERVRIIVSYGYDGVAYADGAGFGGNSKGARIVVSAPYALAHPGDVGMIVHEMTHIVQAYPDYDPVWLVEGIADWVRWFNWEKVDKRPRPNPAKATARDSYQTTGAFLSWASSHYDINLVPKLNKAFRTHSYKESLFRDYTGKTLDELDAEWRKSLK